MGERDDCYRSFRISCSFSRHWYKGTAQYSREVLFYMREADYIHARFPYEEYAAPWSGLIGYCSQVTWF